MDDRAVVLMIRGRLVVDLRWKTGVDWKRSQFRQTERALIDDGGVVFMICGRFVVDMSLKTGVNLKLVAKGCHLLAAF